MGVRKAGDVLAEIGALREHKHESSVRASSKAELLFLPREAIAPILARNKDAASFLSSYTAIRMAGGAVSRLFDLKGKVDQTELSQLVRSVGVKRVDAGATVLAQGSTADKRLYVVRQGQVRIVREEEGTQYAIGTARQGETFGEFAALNAAEQPASVIAETEVVLLVIPEESLRLVLERKPQAREFLEGRVAGGRPRTGTTETGGGATRPARPHGSERPTRDRRTDSAALQPGGAGGGSRLRRRLPRDDLQALQHRPDAGKAQGDGQRLHGRRDARQPRARGRVARLHDARHEMHV